MYERQLLKELEALRGDVSNAAKKVAPSAAPPPKPTVIPPLEDFSRPPMPRALAPGPGPGNNGVHQHTTVRTPPPSNQPITSHNGDPLLAQGPSLQSSPSLHSPVPSSSSQFYTHRPLSPSSTQASIVSRLGPSSVGPSSPGPPQSPGAGPSSPSLSSEATTSPKQPIDDSPPLGGRFVDGTRSMFVKPTPSSTSPLASPPTVSSSSSFSPNPSRMSGDPLSGSLNRPVERHVNSNGFDPLGQARPGYMSASVRVQPIRPRLDAREAASKLANMF